MWYFVILAAGVFGGAICTYLWLEHRRRAIVVDAQSAKYLREAVDARHEVIDQRLKELESREQVLRNDRAEFDKRLVRFEELKQENLILKRDLRNTYVQMRKLQLDRESQQVRQKELDELVVDLGRRYLKDNVKWLTNSLTTNNFAGCKQRLLDAVERCRSIGCAVPVDEEREIVDELKAEFQRVVRAAFEREEQARIKAQIREEQAREREIEREVKQIEREQAAIRAALEKALADTKDEHSAEVERLRERLQEAEARQERAVSQAQLTKSGHVYVISNIGSFGEGVFKIGMTRRLEPLERVQELSDASVPFPFDVHMMISSNDAPSLENAIHRELHKLRINKVNPRKEFFRTDLEVIRKLVVQNHGEVSFQADAEALEYRQSVGMADEDEEFIEQTFDQAEKGHHGEGED